MITNSIKSLASRLSESNYKDVLLALKQQVKHQFKDNPSIMYIKPLVDQTFIDQNIAYNLKVLPSLQKKPAGNIKMLETPPSDHQQDKQLNEQQAVDSQKPAVAEEKDIFMPPFEDGQFIDHVTDYHSLIFNKFCVSDDHVLIITREFQEQVNPLSVDDLIAGLLTCKALGGFLFFNCGPNSGASIKHKHQQVIPYESLTDKILPIEQAALKYCEETKIEGDLFRLPQFNKMKHIFHKINPKLFDEQLESLEQVEQAAIDLENKYWDCMEALGNNDYDYTKSYNLILMKNFLLIVMRKQDGYKDPETGIFLSVNSVGFVGSLAVKNQESLELLKSIGPNRLLELISQPYEE